MANPGSKTVRGPSGGRGAVSPSACRGTRWSRCGRATSAARIGLRNDRMPRHARHDRVLHRVLGLERRSQHPVAVGGQLRPMLFETDPQLVVRAAEPERRFLHDAHRTGSSHRAVGNAGVSIERGARRDDIRSGRLGTSAATRVVPMPRRLTTLAETPLLQRIAVAAGARKRVQAPLHLGDPSWGLNQHLNKPTTWRSGSGTRRLSRSSTRMVRVWSQWCRPGVRRWPARSPGCSAPRSNCRQRTRSCVQR